MPDILRASLRIAAAVTLVVVTACGRGTGTAPEAPVPTLAPGALVEATPETFDRVLRSLRGRPVVVNFWATWCGPCKDEMPRLVRVANHYAGKVVFLGVDVEDADGAARRFIAEQGMPFASLADPKGEIRRAEQVVGLPTTQFYRADGELAFVHSGEIELDVLAERVAELVEIGRPPKTPEAHGASEDDLVTPRP